MSTTKKPQDPSSGGRYRRERDGTLRQVHKTEPVNGRTEASRAALAERMGDAAGAPADTADSADTQE